MSEANQMQDVDALTGATQAGDETPQAQNPMQYAPQPPAQVQQSQVPAQQQARPAATQGETPRPVSFDQWLGGIDDYTRSRILAPGTPAASPQHRRRRSSGAADLPVAASGL